MALSLGLFLLVQAVERRPAAQEDDEPRVYSGEVVSRSYHVDRIYKSMAGPTSTVRFSLPDAPQRELLWIIGYEAEVVDAETLTPVSQEFMCHANLDFAQGEPGLIARPRISGRLFTLSQGQQTIRFPDGLAIPALSSQRLLLNTQVLNLNLPAAALDLKHRARVLVLRDRELTTPMRPLYQRAVQVMKALDEPRYYGLNSGEADPARHGASCAVGQAASDGQFYTDDLDQRFTAHWVVPPGRDVSRNNVTRWLGLHRDTTLHYIAVHLHPFAESMELIDLTAQKTLFKATARNAQGRIGLEQVDWFSSEEGIPVYADHEYEAVSVYNNTSGEPVDAMASMFLYLLDLDFRKPPTP